MAEKKKKGTMRIPANPVDVIAARNKALKAKKKAAAKKKKDNRNKRAKYGRGTQ